MARGAILEMNKADLSSFLPGSVSPCNWDIPKDLTEGDWKRYGSALGKMERGVSWWIGDWWVFGENKYGDRKAATEAKDWPGPSLSTCTHCASASRAFDETCRRRHDLTFSHHVEVSSLPAQRADELLDWCEERKNKPHSVRELRAEVSKLKSPYPAASSETCEVKDLVKLSESGEKFGCIYADPPWLYDNQGTRASTGNHYSGMTVEEICKLPISDLAAKDAHLHLWITNAFLFDAPRIFKAWGFEFRSTFIWVKPQMGIGNYWRNSHEIMLTAIKGDAKRFSDKSLKSYLECDRAGHSDKPDEVRAMLEKASPGPRLELFGRLIHNGWKVWGNQIERTLFSSTPSIVPFIQPSVSPYSGDMYQGEESSR